MTAPSRFAIHDMRSLDKARRRRSRDWDYRFILAVLLLYGCVGVAFFAVEWMHTSPESEMSPDQDSHDWSPTGGGARPGLHPIIRPLAREPADKSPTEGR